MSIVNFLLSVVGFWFSVSLTPSAVRQFEYGRHLVIGRDVDRLLLSGLFIFHLCDLVAADA
jgi:hypothetical protein